MESMSVLNKKLSEFTDDFWVVKYFTSKCYGVCSPSVSEPYLSYLARINAENLKFLPFLQAHHKHRNECTICGLYLDRANTLEYKMGKEDYDAWMKYCRDTNQKPEILCCYCNDLMNIKQQGFKSGIVVFTRTNIFVKPLETNIGWLEEIEELPKCNHKLEVHIP